MKATINLILHSKGGMGKSFIASLMSQYFLHVKRPTSCFDTDPNNSTFGAFKALNVKIVDICDRVELEMQNGEGDSYVIYTYGSEINTRYFDMLIEDLLQLPEEVEAVVDVGSSNYKQLAKYMQENKIPTFWENNGHPLRVHTIVGGGQNLDASEKCINELLIKLKTQLTVWVNPFFGPVNFINSAMFQNNKSRFDSVIHLPSFTRETYGYDLNRVLQDSLTFDEAIDNPGYNLMARQRIKIYRDAIYALLGPGKAEL